MKGCGFISVPFMEIFSAYVVHIGKKSSLRSSVKIYVPLQY